MKFDDPTSQQYQALFRTHGGTQGPGVAIDYDDRGPGVRRQIHVGVRNASAIIANFSTEPSEVPIPPASEWHHITVTYDQSATGTPTNLYMYVDGAHKGNWKGTKDGDETPSQNNSNMALRLGGIQHEQGSVAGYLTGSLDEVAIWNVVLDSDSIINLASGTLASAVSASNIVSYFNMEGGPGSGSLTNYLPAISGTLTGTLMGNFVTGAYSCA